LGLLAREQRDRNTEREKLAAASLFSRMVKFQQRYQKRHKKLRRQSVPWTIGALLQVVANGSVMMW